MNDIIILNRLSCIAMTMSDSDPDYSPVEWLAILLLKTHLNRDEMVEVTSTINEYLERFPGVRLCDVQWDTAIADDLLTYFDHSIVGALLCDIDTITSFMFIKLQRALGTNTSSTFCRLILLYGWRRVEWMNVTRPNGDNALSSIMYQVALHRKHPWRYRTNVPTSYFANLHQIVVGTMRRHLVVDSNPEIVNELITEALCRGMDELHVMMMVNELHKTCSF